MLCIFLYLKNCTFWCQCCGCCRCRCCGCYCCLYAKSEPAYPSRIALVFFILFCEDGFGIKIKQLKNVSIQVHYIIHVQEIKPWPRSQSLRYAKSVLSGFHCCRWANRIQ